MSLFSLVILYNKFRFRIASLFFSRNQVAINARTLWTYNRRKPSSLRSSVKCSANTSTCLPPSLRGKFDYSSLVSVGELDWRKSPLCFYPCLLFVARQFMKNRRSHDSFISQWSMLFRFPQNKKYWACFYREITDILLCGKFFAKIYPRVRIISHNYL